MGDKVMDDILLLGNKTIACSLLRIIGTITHTDSRERKREKVKSVLAFSFLHSLPYPFQTSPDRSRVIHSLTIYLHLFPAIQSRQIAFTRPFPP